MVGITNSEILASQVLKTLGFSEGYPSCRVIVDIQPQKPIRVYVEAIGSDSLLDIKWDYQDLEIISKRCNHCYRAFESISAAEYSNTHIQPMWKGKRCNRLY
jgi:hypothetical protein